MTQKFTFSKTAKDRHGCAIKVDITICVDATGSMDPYIEGIVLALKAFLDILSGSGLDVQVGLVVFRDETYNEETKCYKLTTNFGRIKNVLSKTEAMGGGDIEESSLLGIHHGIGLDGYRADARTLILLITDAPCHDPESGYSSSDALRELQENDAVFFACSPVIEPYKTLVNATQGVLFPIETHMDADTFKDVMLSVAHATVKTMRADGPSALPSSLTSELRKTLRFSE